jgi:D-sedoheptulose 7-phosphate isomerase
MATLTACANDLGYPALFERLVGALGRTGDVLVALSTFGMSENVIRGLREARARGLVTVGLLGGSGGAALTECDHAVLVPSNVTAHIQEAHLALGHTILELVEDALL